MYYDQKINIQHFTYLTFAVAVLTPRSGHAQPAQILMGLPTLHGGETNRPQLFQSDVDLSYTASSKAKFLGTKSSDKSDAFNVGATIFAPLPLNDKWIVPFGLESQNIYLGSIPGVPVDDAIHTLSFNTGIGHRLNDDWMIMGMFNPTLYKFSDVGGNDIGFSGGVNAMWHCSDPLTLVFGLMVAPDSDIAVLPMAGADWHINEQWELRAMFPQPRIIYTPADHWNYYFGGNLPGATYRSSDNLGTSIGRPQYNDALATYRDIRVGVGVGYNLNQFFRAEVEAGYSVSRQIEFKDANETVKFDPAPYVRVGLNFGF